MKTEISQTPVGLTVTIRLEQEKYVSTFSQGDEMRVDLDFEERKVRVYSDEPWQFEAFSRSGVKGRVVA